VYEYAYGDRLAAPLEMAQDMKVARTPAQKKPFEIKRESDQKTPQELKSELNHIIQKSSQAVK